VSDGGEEIAGAAERHCDQERVGIVAERVGNDGGDWPEHQHRRGVVQERRQNHRRRHHQRNGRRARNLRGDAGDRLADEIGHTRGLKALGDRDERGKQHEHRPFDRLICVLE